MMKKVILGTALLLGATAFSTASMAQDGLFGGPYVGVYGGYGWTEADVTGGGTVEPDGADYGIYAGFKADKLLDSTVNQTGLGLTGAVEVSYGWSSADDNVGGVSIEKDSEFGISFRPGLSFLNNDSVVNFNPYGILGYRRANYEASIGGLSADEDFDGFELGIGTELVAYGDYGVRVEYSHTFYGEEGGFDPDEDNVRLGVSYHF